MNRIEDGTPPATPTSFPAPSRTNGTPMLLLAALVFAAGCGPGNNETSNNSETNNETSNNSGTNNATSNNSETNNATSNNTTPAMATFTLSPLNGTDGSALDTEMCERDTDNCATGVGEDVSIELPVGTDAAVVLTSEGFYTSTWYINVDEDTTYRTPMLPSANIDQLIEAFELADDPSLGHIFFNAQTSEGGVGGVTMGLEPDTSELILYNGLSGPNPSLTATLIGNGAYMNVEAGSYTLTGVHETLNCTAPAGHQQGADGASTFEVVAGEATYVFVVCE